MRFRELGTGDNTDRNQFVQVFAGAIGIAAGLECTFVLKADGTLWATGYTVSGQLGMRNS